MGHQWLKLGQAVEEELNRNFNEWGEWDLDVRYGGCSFIHELEKLEKLKKLDESWGDAIWAMHQFGSRRRRGPGDGR